MLVGKALEKYLDFKNVMYYESYFFAIGILSWISFIKCTLNDRLMTKVAGITWR